MYAELVVESAERVFARDGYDATKVQDVAREAAISLSTLYGVFASKADIWRAIHDKHLARLFGRLAAPTGAGADRLDLLLTGVERYVRYMLDNPDYLRMQLLDGHAWAAGTGTGTSDLQSEAWSRGRRQMARGIAAGIASGLLVEDDPELLARLMVAMHQVRLAHWVDTGMDAAPDDVVAAIQRQTIRAFCVPERVASALEQLEGEP